MQEATPTAATWPADSRLDDTRIRNLP